MKNLFISTTFYLSIICFTHVHGYASNNHASETQVQFVNAQFEEDQTFAQQGKMYFDCGNYGAAWASFNEAIKINSNEWFYFYMRAACTANLGNYKAALVDYNKALTLAKDNDSMGWIHYDMALMYAKMGDENNAKSHLITSAKLGNGLAQNFCIQYAIRYS